jgi:hypothetical protein
MRTSFAVARVAYQDVGCFVVVLLYLLEEILGFLDGGEVDLVGCDE